MSRSRSSLVRRSCSVAHSRSMRPLAWGEWARIKPIPKGLEHAAEVRRVLVPLQLFGERPVGIVAGEDVEAVAGEFPRGGIRWTRGGGGGDIAMDIFVRA